MAAIPLGSIGGAIAVVPPPWSNKAIILKRASYPKGAIPPHLRSHVERFKAAVSKCKAEIVRGKGAATVQGFNSCISAELK